MLYRHGLGGLLAVLLGLLSNTAAANQIFVTIGSSTIGAYTTSGDTVNPALITGLSDPEGIAIAPAVAPVPEPNSTLTLFGLVLAGLVFRGRCKRAS